MGLANIRAEVPDIDANKEKILRAIEVFKQKGVNIAIFPEFCLSGYFWEDEPKCWSYMERAVTENHCDWIDRYVRSQLDDSLRGVVLNNIKKGIERKYYNATYVISRKHEYMKQDEVYCKTFLPTLEKIYTETASDDRLVIDTNYGKVGFTTCYDICFSQLILEYAVIDGIDLLIQNASWRAMARRDYPQMNVKTDAYYGYLWDLMMASTAAKHQIWIVACNAVGMHGVSGVNFWGGSGVWAPSGLCLAQASRVHEELLIVHNLDIKTHREFEKDDFNYALDFTSIYRPVQGKRTFTRIDIDI
ncbi:MAG: carbon-nitrogen hydrolase family protein [Deltaproteobacteria bacterium]|nr:carbon-nitrogen hydrolase family protein [Deltaproteobacteria bacterium]